MPQTHPSDPPDRSPLESIVGSRASIASEASGELGILDSFPLPAGIVPPSPRNSPDSSGYWSPDSSIANSTPSLEPLESTVDSQPPKDSKSSPYPVLATEQRYRRYGHHYQLSNDSDTTEVCSSSQTSMSSGDSEVTEHSRRKNTPTPLKLTSISSTPQRRYRFPSDHPLNAALPLNNSPQLNTLDRSNPASAPSISVQSAPPSAGVAPLSNLSSIPQTAPVEATFSPQKSPCSSEVRSPTSARSQFLPSSRRFHHSTSRSAHSILHSDGSPSKPMADSLAQPLITASWQLEPNQLNPNQLNPNQLNSNQLNPNQLNPNQPNHSQQNYNQQNYTQLQHVPLDRSSGPSTPGLPGLSNQQRLSGSPGSKPARPRASRAHSVSQSWDAGSPARPHPAPLPLNLPPLAPLTLPNVHSSEEHIKVGVNLMAFNNNLVLAHRYWETATAPPLNSAVGMLLLVLGHSERWFPPGLQVSPTVADSRIDFQQVGRTVGLVTRRLPSVPELQNLLGPILPRVVNAIRGYADKLLARQLDLEALEFLELSGNLGSAQSLMTAASIYYKGSRRVRKDVGRSTRLFERASKLT